MKHLRALKKYNEIGLCSVPISIKDKYPSMLMGWKKFETQFPTPEELQSFNVYYDAKRFGCCMICGKISGGLLVIDFDNHLRNAEEIFNAYTDFPEVKEIIQKYDLPIETTQSGGYHIYLKLDPVPGNVIFAQDYNEEGKITTLIETRGQGGLIVCAPTVGYEVVSGDLTDIKEITPEEFEILSTYAKTFDKVERTKKPVIKQTIERGDKDRPGDIFNERVDPATILKNHGWTNVGRNPKLWRRPGKEKGVSGTLGYIAPGIFYNFSSNAYPLEERKCYTAFTLYAAYEHNNDLSAAAKQIAKDLGLKSNKKKEYTKDEDTGHQKKTAEKREPTIPPKDPIHFNGIKIVTKTTEQNNRIFWYVTDRGAVEIDYKSLNEFLVEEGFYKYQINQDSIMLVKITGNVVEEYTPDMIYNYVRKHIDRMDPDGTIYNKIRKNKSMLNAEDLSRELETIEIDFVEDTKEFTYVFYKNTCVKVSADGFSLIRYEDLPGKVWKKQIIDRDFKVIPDEEVDESDAAKLVSKLSADNQDRILAYMTAMGYLINRYKTQESCPVIDWCDEDMQEGESRGGTGKGLSMKMLKQIRNVVVIDGKSFDTTKSFTFSRVNPDTDIILIDDIDKKYDFQKLFSLVTEGLPIEKKYMNEIYLEFKDAPKWAITRNHPIAGKGDSFDRRLFTIEIHPFLSANHTPSDFLGKPFFDWDADEWLRFDNFMMYCARFYLKYGLQKPRYVNLELNRLKANTRPGFVEWAEDNLREGEQYDKKDLLNKFIEDEKLGYAHISQRRFNSWLDQYCEYKGYNYNINYGSGKRYLMIHLKGYSEQPEKEEIPQKNDSVPF